MTELLLDNARLILPGAVIAGHVLIADGLIREIGQGRSRSPAALDCEGDYLLPGLVELHTDN
ncbi:hypothetical protein AB4084_34440, partial [Lysobacter sp. 2RAB21]